MKEFIFNWQKNERSPIVRNTHIKSHDAQSATSVFMKEMGNLKKNTINFIQEVDKEGNNIGEPIVPM